MIAYPIYKLLHSYDFLCGVRHELLMICHNIYLHSVDYGSYLQHKQSGIDFQINAN